MVAVAVLVAACARTPGGDGLPGSLIAVDDTGLRSSTITDAWIVAVPQGRAEDFWASGGLPTGFTDYAHVQMEVDEGALMDLGAIVTPVNEHGRFRLGAPAGPAVICQMLSTTRVGRLSTMGCSSLDVPDGGGLEATYGEGGFFIGPA